MRSILQVRGESDLEHEPGQTHNGEAKGKVDLLHARGKPWTAMKKRS